MKKLLLCLLLCTSSFATITSIYKEATGFPVYMYTQKAECEQDGGSWQEDMCFFEEDNIIEIDITKDAITRISVETFSTNGHMCSVEATNIKEDKDKIIAQTRGEEYDFQNDRMVYGACIITLTKNSDGTMGAEANGKCRSYCGMRGYIGIDSAIKTK